jgi:hypothetical protein
MSQDPAKAFSNDVHKHFEGIVKAMKKHSMVSFTTQLTDISGKTFELTVKPK